MGGVEHGWMGRAPKDGGGFEVKGVCVHREGHG